MMEFGFSEDYYEELSRFRYYLEAEPAEKKEKKFNSL